MEAAELRLLITGALDVELASSEDEVELSVLAVLLSSDFAHEDTTTAILTIRTNQDNILFILFLILENVEEVGLKCHKFKLFNPIDIRTKTKY